LILSGKWEQLSGHTLGEGAEVRMSFLKNFFGKKKPAQMFEPQYLGGKTRVTLECPQCKALSDMYLGDPRCTWVLQREDVGVLIPAECPYCKIGMLVCIKDDKLMNIEPFGDAPDELMSALERTTAKVTAH
jgi:hypothetical protein